MTPVIGVLALQGDVREHLAALGRAGARTRTVRRPAELDGLDGIVIPGGESTTMDRLLNAFSLAAPLSAALADGLPAYGSCAGMIELADRLLDGAPGQRTLGGLDITVRRNAFGRQVDSFETDLKFPDLGAAPFHAVFIRAPWVESVGPGVRILATVPVPNDDGSPPSGPGRIVAVQQASLLATSFHPEIAGDGRVHELFVKIAKG